MKSKSIALGLAAVALLTRASHGEGHGPAFALATPTLAERAWSSDTMLMSIGNKSGTSFMAREMIGYGINQDLQAVLTFPLSRVVDPIRPPPNMRLGAMGGSFTDVEGSLLWRFHRRAPAVGTRFESTLLVGGAMPTESQRGPIRNSASVNIAAVTGYASRTFYGWFGGGVQRHFDRDGDRIGTLPYVTAVVGYRPPLFQQDYPKPDWRIFIENLNEFPERDQMNGTRRPDSGGRRFLLGPSVLGLYGNWGIEAGALFPVRESLNGNQVKERFRTKFVLSYWF